MSDKELEEYINKIEPNFDSHLEKGTIEMSNEYYNLLEEKMIRLINENQELKLELSGYRQAILNNKEMLGLKEKNDKLKKQLHEASLTIQELAKQDIECPSNCEKLRQLKKQLTTYQILHRDCKVDNLKNISKIEEMETQQKEFIEYMNKTIEELEYDNVDDEEMKGYLIQRIDTFKEILQKYRSIIGGKDEK